MSSRTLAWILFSAGLLALIMRVQVATMGPEARVLVREQNTYQALRKTISDRYVDNVNEKDLFFGAMQGMAGVLDRHTVFWTPEQYELEKTETSGHFAGIGIEIRFDDQKGMIIVTPIAGTPAFNAKLMPGDRILKIDDESVDKLTQEEASKRVRGAPGTQVQLTIARDGVEGNLSFTITRAVIKVDSVQEACVLAPPLSAAARIPADAPKIGYIQVAAFQEETSQDIEKAIEQMRPLGLKALIIDLRQNRGGLLTTAVDVCDLFLNEGVIVTTRGRAAQGEEEIFSATKKTGAYDFPLAVMIDSSSASASEIVAGCLHDHGRALLVGEKSYGKGSVQTIIPVEMGNLGEGALKLTTAKYYTPSNVCIDGKGIEPDFKVPFKIEQLRALLYERRRRRLAINDPRGNGAVPAEPTPASKTEKTPAGPKPEEKTGEPEKPDPDDEVEPEKPKEPFFDLQLEKAVEVLTKQLQQK